MYQRILVPLDGSELAEGVLPWVESLVQCTGAEVVLARVVTLPQYDYLVADPELHNALREGMDADAQAYLERVAAELRCSGAKVRTQVCPGHNAVAEALIDLADTLEADVIAMSTHGRTGPARWLLGSVADRVVRGAHCPVLMVRPAAERLIPSIRRE